MPYGNLPLAVRLTRLCPMRQPVVLAGGGGRSAAKWQVGDLPHWQSMIAGLWLGLGARNRQIRRLWPWL